MSETKPAIFFSVHTQFENMGDALINREMIRLAESQGDVYLDISRMPDAFLKTLGVKDRPAIHTEQGFLSLLQKMIRQSVLQKRDCYYFLCPGGNGGELKGKALILSKVKLALFALMRLCGVKICHIGVSFDNLGGNHAAYLRKRSKYFHRFFVRDETTYGLLNDKKIPVDGVMPDLAFNLFDTNIKPAQTVKTVCFSFRTDQFDGQTETIKQRLQEITAHLPKKTHYVFTAQVERDAKGMEILHDWMKDELNLSTAIYINATDIEAQQEFYATCDMVVSNRLHSLLLGATRCGICLPLINDHNVKIGSLYETVGATQAIINQDAPITAEQLKRAMTATIDGTTQASKLRHQFSEIFTASV